MGIIFWGKENFNKFKEYLPPALWLNGIKKSTELLNQIRKAQFVTNNTIINNNYWNQNTLNNNYTQNINYNINIYQLPQSPETAKRPYLKSTDYLNPLGEAGANQTPYNTPKDTPITLLEQTAEQKQTYGKLTYNPQSSQYIQQIRSQPNNELFDNEIAKFNELSRSSVLAQKYYKLNTEEEPPETVVDTKYQGFLLIPSNLKGNSGKGEFLFGISTISALAQKYRANSTIALLPPSNEIPKSIDVVETSDDYHPLEFEGKLQIDVIDPQTLLGFSVFDNFESSIEDKLIELGKSQYEDQNYGTGNKAKKLTSVAEYFTHLISVLFFRSGFHRLPSILPNLVTGDIPDNLKDQLESEVLELAKSGDFEKASNLFKQYYSICEDNIDFQSYLIKSLDGLFGNFPIKINVLDAKGQPQELILTNLAETLAELTGIALNIDTNTETNLPLTHATLAEATRGANMATQAYYQAKGNADYLGYKTKQEGLEIALPYDPKGEGLLDQLKPSKLKLIVRKNVDDEAVRDDLKLILATCQLIKGSIVQKNTDFFMGDRIKELKKEEKEKFDKEWNELLNKYNNGKMPFKNVKIINKPVPKKPK